LSYGNEQITLIVDKNKIELTKSWMNQSCMTL
jgi:hypothetical protein